MMLTGLNGIVAVCLLFPAFRSDMRARRKTGGVNGKLALWPGAPEVLLLLGMGAGLAEAGNLFVSLFLPFLTIEDYARTMDMVMAGKTFAEMILWMAVAAPLAEEVVFRWMVYLRLRDRMSTCPAIILSAALFGLYHGDLAQGVYAFLLGMAFAWVMERSGALLSSVLLHIGANTWSLVLSSGWSLFLEAHPDIRPGQYESILFAAAGIVILCMAAGMHYYSQRQMYTRERN